MDIENVVVYRSQLLPISEVFIARQAKAYVRHRPHFVGTQSSPAFESQTLSGMLLLGTSPSRRRLQRLQITGILPRQPLAALRKLKPVLVHAHFGPDGVQALPLARRLEIPLIVTFHGFDITMSDEALRRNGLPNQIYVLRRHVLARKGARFIAVSAFIRQRLLDKGFPPERTITKYIGVDTKLFRPTTRATRQDYVLFVGRLVANKGADHLVRAMTLVQRENPDIELVVIGDGPERASLERLITTCRVRARMLGAQDAATIRDWMWRARVFCSPSVTINSGASEGFGLAPLEAQAAGLPVVSYDTGGLPEAVLDKETGLLAREGDWRELALHLIRLVSSQETWDRMSIAGTQRAVDRFEITDKTRELEEVYDCVRAEQ